MELEERAGAAAVSQRVPEPNYIKDDVRDDVNFNIGGKVNGTQLRDFIARIERLNEEIASLNADKGSIFAEAKSSGFNVKVMKRLIQRRKREQTEAQEEDDIMEIYMAALGMD